MVGVIKNNSNPVSFKFVLSTVHKHTAHSIFRYFSGFTEIFAYIF